MENPTKAILQGVRFSYANVFVPKKIQDSEDEKYSVSVLIPKDNEAAVVEAKRAITAAYNAGVEKKFNGKRPKAWKNPLRDGDTEREDEAYAGHYFINANSTRQPQVVDASVRPIIDQEEFYSGCYGNVSINFFAFNWQGNKGVGAGLQNIQKTKDGDRLGGSASTAAEDFGAFSTIEEDDDLF